MLWLEQKYKQTHASIDVSQPAQQHCSLKVHRLVFVKSPAAAVAAGEWTAIIGLSKPDLSRLSSLPVEV